jgi:hypothetical protein
MSAMNFPQQQTITMPFHTRLLSPHDFPGQHDFISMLMPYGYSGEEAVLL